MDPNTNTKTEDWFSDLSWDFIWASIYQSSVKTFDALLVYYFLDYGHIVSLITISTKKISTKCRQYSVSQKERNPREVNNVMRASNSLENNFWVERDCELS